MAGFDNEVLYANNVDFSGGFPVTGKVVADGQLLIGSTATPNIKVGTLASSNGTITITNGSGTIDLVASGTGVAQTLTGNAGVASPVAGNINVQTANTTVEFLGSGDTLTQDFGLGNLLIGSEGAAITSGTFNVSLGFRALEDVTSGSANTAIGYHAARDTITGGSNTTVGHLSLALNTSSSSNTGLGQEALAILTSGLGGNTAIGLSSLLNLQSGNNNIAIGVNSGNSYTLTDSNNIAIGALGTTGESNAIHIGTAGSGTGQQNKTFVAGITGVTVAASAPTGVDTNGQLSSLGFGTANQVFTSNGAGSSPTWQAASASGAVTTITGNDAVAVSPTAGNIGLVTADSNITFTGAGSTLTLDFNPGASSNTFIGHNGSTITSGNNNVSMGSTALDAITSGTSNNCFGVNSGGLIAGGSDNNCYGRNSGAAIVAGGQNLMMGGNAGSPINGSNNVFLGYNTGSSLSGTCSNNIYIGSGVTGSGTISNSIRIGGTHTTAFIDGISGVTVSASAPIGVDTNDQLSSLGFGTSGQSFISGGAGVSPSWALVNLASGVTGTLPVANGGLASTGITGIVAGTGSAYNGRTITGTTNAIAITNGNGSAGNPTINFSPIVAFTSTQPSMLAYKSANTTNTTGDGTLYTVIFDTETYDQGGNYNNATGVFTCPVTGNYMITGNVGFTAFGTSTSFISYVTAVPLYQTYNSSQAVANVGALGNIWCPFSSILRLTSGTTITIVAQGNGGALNNTIIGGGAYATWLSIVLVN